MFLLRNDSLYSIYTAISKTEPWTLNREPEPGPSKTWTLKNMDPEKHRINMGLKSMSDFRELCFVKTIFQAKNYSYNYSHQQWFMIFKYHRS